MKITMHVDISNINKFLLGQYDQCFYLSSYETGIEDWHYVGPIEIEVPDNVMTELSLRAIAEIEKAEKKTTAKYNEEMESMKRRKQELMALPAPSTQPLTGDRKGC